MRSAVIDRFRKGAPRILGLNSEFFAPNYRRETVPELVRLLRFTTGSKDPSKKARPSKLPPILYPLHIRQKGREGHETKIFQSRELFMVSE